MNGTVSRAHKEPKGVIHREADELASVKSDELASPMVPSPPPHTTLQKS